MKTEEIAKTALQKGMSSVVVLTGDAPTQHNNNCVEINGNIDAPQRFLKGRFSTFDKLSSHCLVSTSEGKIVLVLNEQSSTDKFTVTGKIEVANKFTSLGINKSDVAYSPEQLANKLKLLRSLFVSNLDHANICSTLRNIKAKVSADVEKLDDRKGNVERNFKQVVESNMPNAIKLKLPLLEGEPAIEIEVNVILEVNGGSDIKCYLESIDAADLIESQFEKRVNEEVEEIEKLVTVIKY
jgi:hypothetical protein